MKEAEVLPFGVQSYLYQCDTGSKRSDVAMSTLMMFRVIVRRRILLVCFTICMYTMVHHQKGDIQKACGYYYYKREVR